MSGAISVDTSGLLDLATRLRARGVATQEAFDTELFAAGEAVAALARANASYSSKVPGSIVVETVGPGTVRVVTRLPEAVAIENAGKGYVRHPLFGNYDHFYGGRSTPHSKPAFLLPAFRKSVAALAKAGIRAFLSAWESVV